MHICDGNIVPYVEWGWSELGDMPHGHGRMVLLQGLKGKVRVMEGPKRMCRCFAMTSIWEAVGL